MIRKIEFSSQRHEERFLNCIAKHGSNIDDYYLSLFYLLSLDKEVYKNISKFYDFKENLIYPMGVDEAMLTSTTIKLIRLAFNLFNGFCPQDDDEIILDDSKMFTPSEIFCCSYASYFLEAIKLRYPEYTK